MATKELPVGPPRMDPYLRVLHRFYEPLFLLKQLSPFLGDYILVHPRDGTMTAIQRRFIKNLAYICDSRKGGETTAAVALEQEKDSFCFWVAQNATASKETQSFLEKSLEMLKEAATAESSDTLHAIEDRLLQNCTNFAKQRINKERNLLVTSLRSCMEYETDNQGIASLLQGLEDCIEPMLVCQLAFRGRHLSLRCITAEAIRLLADGRSTDGALYHISNARHRIGRLAHHVRVARQLIEDSQYLVPVLDKYKVTCVMPVPSIPALEEDTHTTIHGILRRMLPQGDSRFKGYKELIESLNQKFQIFDQFLECYRSDVRKPVVHCEIQVLEHFYNQQLQYFNRDRFIGCSKFSCLCCRLYFRYHPAKCVEPESHQKIYPNWSPPLLATGASHPGFSIQRSIFNEMNTYIRRAVFDELEKKHEQTLGRADSITEISSATESLEIN